MTHCVWQNFYKRKSKLSVRKARRNWSYALYGKLTIREIRSRKMTGNGHRYIIAQCDSSLPFPEIGALLMRKFHFFIFFPHSYFFLLFTHWSEVLKVRDFMFLRSQISNLLTIIFGEGPLGVSNRVSQIRKTCWRAYY